MPTVTKIKNSIPLKPFNPGLPCSPLGPLNDASPKINQSNSILDQILILSINI